MLRHWSMVFRETEIWVSGPCLSSAVCGLLIAAGSPFTVHSEGVFRARTSLVSFLPFAFKELLHYSPYGCTNLHSHQQRGVLNLYTLSSIYCFGWPF